MHQFVFVQWSDPSRACLLHLFSAGREGGAQAPPFSEPLWRQVEQIPSYTITRTRKFASLSVLFASHHGQILQEHPVSTKSTQPPYSSSEISNSPPPPRADVICGSPRRNAPPVRVSLPKCLVVVTARQIDLPMSHICYLFSPIFKRAKILTWLSYEIPQI